MAKILEEGVWRTIGGRRVFIKTGQSLKDAMKESGKFESKKKEHTKEDYIKQEQRMHEAKEEMDKLEREISIMEGDDMVYNSPDYEDKVWQLRDARDKYKEEYTKYSNMLQDKYEFSEAGKDNAIRSIIEDKYIRNGEYDQLDTDRLELYRDKFYNRGDDEIGDKIQAEIDRRKLPQRKTKKEYRIIDTKDNKVLKVYKEDEQAKGYGEMRKMGEELKKAGQEDNLIYQEYRVKANKTYPEDKISKVKSGSPIEDLIQKEGINVGGRLREVDDETIELFKSIKSRNLDDEQAKTLLHFKYYDSNEDNLLDKYKQWEKSISKIKSGNDYLPKASKILTAGTSNRKEVSDNIQAHILSYYDNPVDFMEEMDHMDWLPTKWHSGQEMAKGGSYLIYNDDISNFLNELNINPKGKSFSSDRSFEVYSSLIGRESERLYNRMQKLYEQYKKEHKGANISLDDFRKWFK